MIYRRDEECLPRSSFELSFFTPQCSPVARNPSGNLALDGSSANRCACSTTHTETRVSTCALHSGCLRAKCAPLLVRWRQRRRLRTRTTGKRARRRPWQSWTWRRLARQAKRLSEMSVSYGSLDGRAGSRGEVVVVDSAGRGAEQAGELSFKSIKTRLASRRRQVTGLSAS
jgi:hypothetical protein